MLQFSEFSGLQYSMGERTGVGSAEHHDTHEGVYFICSLGTAYSPELLQPMYAST